MVQILPNVRVRYNDVYSHFKCVARHKSSNWVTTIYHETLNVCTTGETGIIQYSTLYIRSIVL